MSESNTRSLERSIPVKHHRADDMARRLLTPAIFVLAVALVASALGTYQKYVVTLVLCAAVVGGSLSLLVGYARCITLATGAMLAIGAYGSALLVVRLGWPLIPSIAVGTVLGGAAGLILGLPGVRFRGHNLAMITLVFQAVVIIVLREWTSLTGGAGGLSIPAQKLLGLDLANDQNYLAFAAIACALMLVALAVFMHGRFGRNLKAIASNEPAAQAYGIPVDRHLVAAFCISSAAIAFAGALQAPRARIIDPDSFGIAASITALAYPIVGGVSSLWGGILGGSGLRIMPEMLRAAADYQELIFCGLVLLVVLFFPDGVVGTIAARMRAVQEKSTGKGTLDLGTAAELGRTAARAAASGAIALELRGVSKAYGALKAIEGVSLQVKAGSIHGLIGPNGAGKTTLFNTISGFIAPDTGEVLCHGAPLEAGKVTSRLGVGIARTFQHVAIFPKLTCLENVAVGLGGNAIVEVVLGSVADAFSRSRRDAQRDLAMKALRDVGLADAAGQLAGTLSLGNQRRLEIARAIVSRPRVVLLDEPVSGVSEEELKGISDLLIGLNAATGATLLIVEHNIRFLSAIADSVTVMAAGRQIVTGSPDDVLADPAVRRIYFGEEHAC